MFALSLEMAFFLQRPSFFDSMEEVASPRECESVYSLIQIIQSFSKALEFKNQTNLNKNKPQALALRNFERPEQKAANLPRNIQRCFLTIVHLPIYAYNIVYNYVPSTLSDRTAIRRTAIGWTVIGWTVMGWRVSGMEWEMVYIKSMSVVDKTVYKIGEMIIDNKQIFWKMKYCYALIPIVQLLDGHVLLAPKRQVSEFSDLEPVEVFDLTLTLKLLTRAMETFYSCTSSTIHIQNSGSSGTLKHLIVHIIPRKAGDLKSNDMIYEMLRTYPEDLLKHYNEKMNFYVNAYANKILQGLNEQARKYESHVNICYKEEKQI